MTDAYRKKQLQRRFDRLQTRAKRAEQDGDNEKAVQLYYEMLDILEEAATLLGSGERERIQKEHINQKIKELSDKNPDESVPDDSQGSSPDVTAEEEKRTDSEETVSIEEIESAVFDLYEPDVSFSDVGGRDRVKRMLRQEVINPLQEPGKYERYGLSVLNGVIFYGPPGTGKTYLAKALAGELDAPVIETSGGLLKGRYLGESEGNVRELFEIALDFDAMIFIDEIDQILQDRRKVSNDGKADMVNEFLSQMVSLDNEQAFVVGATNNPGQLDRAVSNPVRFSEQIRVDLPPKATRYEIIRKLLNRRPDSDLVAWNSIDERTIAEETHGYSASDLELLIRKASRQAAEREEQITQEHLTYGLKQTDPSVSRT